MPTERRYMQAVFGSFCFDLSSCELFRDGLKLRLEEQPAKVLRFLIERANVVVSRDELRNLLWPDDIHVDYEHGVNKSINKLRTTLGDDPAAPRFIATIRGRGYRFVGPLEFQRNGDSKLASVSAAGQEDCFQILSPSAQGHAVGKLWAVVLPSLVALGVAAVWLTARHTTPTNAGLIPVPLTTYAGDEDSPTFSPDGNQVAFYWNGPKPGTAGIYVKVIGRDPPVLLAKTEQGYPAWSPDGRFIAFPREVPGGNCGIFLVSAVGGPVREVAEISSQEIVLSDYNSNSCLPVSWHPNGEWLVGVDKLSASEPCALFLIPVNGGEKRRLTSPRGIRGDHWPAVSPDGRAVAFLRYERGDGGSLEILELTDDLKPVGEPKPLAKLDYVQTLTWTPDGRSVLFTSGLHHSPSLFRLHLLPGWRPGPRERLVFAGEGVFAPVTSRQGRLAFLKVPITDSDIWRVELSKGRWNGKPPVRLISSTRLDHTPAYSPDGKRIAFASTRSGSYEIWICESDGSNPVQLTALGGPDGGPYTASPSWSGDGRSIYFTSVTNGHNAIFVISSEGGHPKQLAEGEALWGSVTRDGRWIYFSSEDSSMSGTAKCHDCPASQAWKMPITGGYPVQVTRSGGGPGRESADEKVLYYTKILGKDTPPDSSSLWKVPVEGGEETQVLNSVHCGNFAITHRGIYFIPNWFAPTIIDFLNFSTNRIEQIAKVDVQPLCGFSLSPDGRFLLYTSLEPRPRSGTGLMLVENFH